MAFSIFTTPVQDVLPVAIKKRVNEHMQLNDCPTLLESTQDEFQRERGANKTYRAQVQSDRDLRQMALLARKSG